MSKTNVLFLAEELRVGGAETYFYKVENKINSDKINFYTCAVNGSCYTKLKNKSLYFEYKKDIFSKFKTIKKIIKEKEIKVIHANSLRLAMIASMVRHLCKEKFKIIYTKHNATILEKVNKMFFSVFVNNEIDVLLTVCNNDKNNMVELGVKEDKIKVIPNSIDLEQFKFNPRYLNKDNNHFKVGILARLSEEKNHKFFINVINEYNRLFKDKNLKAYIAGDGDLKQSIKDQIDENNLSEKIIMVGNIDRSEEFLSDTDVILLVSTREVFPMTLLEAMAVGSIVLSIDVGGIKDCVINDKTGYVIDEYDSTKFAIKIEKIINSYEESKTIIYNARKLVEETFNLHSMIKSIEKLYEEI